MVVAPIATGRESRPAGAARLDEPPAGHRRSGERPRPVRPVRAAPLRALRHPRRPDRRRHRRARRDRRRGVRRRWPSSGTATGRRRISFASWSGAPDPGCDRIFSHCEGFSGRGDLLDWMTAHERPAATHYVNWVGRTVRQVREEQRPAPGARDLSRRPRPSARQPGAGSGVRRPARLRRAGSAGRAADPDGGRADARSAGGSGSSST